MKMRISLTFSALLILCCTCLYAAGSKDTDKRVESLLKQMTLEEKIEYIGGTDSLYVKAIDRLGIPRIRMSDGPMGVRCYGETTSYPGGIALTASWNPELAIKYGQALGRDCRARGVHILLAPAVNIYRSPLCGRNFEYMGEDPYLASTMVVPLIQGIQSQGVFATVKHFACNNQEWDRNSISSEVDERTLREIYLPAFKAAVTKAGVKCVMNSYNLVNGVHASQNHFLLTDILKNEWKFKGFVMSDWASTYDGVAAANAGLDLEMPSGAFMNPQNLLPAVKDGRVKVSVIDDKVRRMLRAFISAGFFDNAQELKEIPKDDPQNVKVALDGAREGIVLLKNQNNLLPLDSSKVKSIAVIGPNADPAVYCGGGSAFTSVFHSISVLDGIKKIAGSNIEVKYSSGKATLTSEYVSPLKMEIFAGKNLSGEPVYTEMVNSIKYDWTGRSPATGIGNDNYSVRWTGKIKPKATGEFTFSASADDGVRVFLDGKLVLNDWEDHAVRETATDVILEADHEYDLRVEFYQATGDSQISFGWGNWIGTDIDSVAKQCDVAVVCVGFTPRTESEGSDRKYDLPAEQVKLINTVVAANPNTIVMINSGGGVAWEGWLDKVPAVLQTWYSGQEYGQAAAEIVFGLVNPSGKLPATFEKKASDNPTYLYYKINDNKKTPYTEGIFVGYRGYDKKNIQPQFCFGYGLSYTTFAFSNLKIRERGFGDKRTYNITCDVTNTGNREGAEVAQLYIGNKGASVPRPIHELKGFNKVWLKPGQKTTAKFTLSKEELSFYNVAKKSWTTEPGEFTISIGSSSRDLPLQGKLIW